MNNIESKTKRIIILSISFFLLGIVFFSFDLYLNSKSKNAPKKLEEKSVATDSPLKNYPDPVNFKYFNYSKNEILPENTLNYSGKCSAKYVTILVFPEQFDYRSDPAKAVVNRAIFCPENGNFEYSIKLNELPLIEENRYYTFVADQNEGQMWYNPRQ